MKVKKGGVQSMIVVFAAVFCCYSAQAGMKTYAGRVSVSGELEKEKNASGKDAKSKSKGETQYYELKITAANTAKTEQSFDVEWYFFERKLDKKGKKGDYALGDKGKKTIVLPGMKRQTFNVKSKDLSWTETKATKKTKKTITGDVYGGYLVLLRVDDHIVSRYSPDQRFTSDKWLSKMSIPMD